MQGPIYQLSNLDDLNQEIDADYLTNPDTFPDVYEKIITDYITNLEEWEKIDIESIINLFRSDFYLSKNNHWSVTLNNRHIKTIETRIRDSLIKISDICDRAIISNGEYSSILSEIRKHSRICDLYFIINDRVVDLGELLSYLKQNIGKKIYIINQLNYHR